MEPTYNSSIEFERASDFAGLKRYVSHPDKKLLVIVGREDGKWHLSMSHTERLPSWDELAQARSKFVPDRLTMAMVLPPRAEYVNLHERTLHLFEINPDELPAA